MDVYVNIASYYCIPHHIKKNEGILTVHNQATYAALTRLNIPAMWRKMVTQLFMWKDSSHVIKKMHFGVNSSTSQAITGGELWALWKKGGRTGLPEQFISLPPTSWLYLNAISEPGNQGVRYNLSEFFWCTGSVVALFGITATHSNIFSVINLVPMLPIYINF